MSRIVVLCPDHDAPSGGVRRLYRDVDVLERAGFDAVLLHQQPGFRCSWFHNTTRVAYAADTLFRAGGWVVVPEVFGPDLASIAPGFPKVVFNQNAYLTFAGYSVDPADRRTPYAHPEVRACLVVSDDNRDYLAYAFPTLPLHRVHYAIEPVFRPAAAMRPLVAYVPRKNAADVVQVVNLLKHSGALDGFRLVPIDGQPEGCPLPPLEAMASGCVVVGYHGDGGREYLLPERAFPVEAGDVVGFARAARASSVPGQDRPVATAGAGRTGAPSSRSAPRPGARSAASSLSGRPSSPAGDQGASAGPVSGVGEPCPDAGVAGDELGHPGVGGRGVAPAALGGEDLA